MSLRIFPQRKPRLEEPNMMDCPREESHPTTSPNSDKPYKKIHGRMHELWALGQAFWEGIDPLVAIPSVMS